MTDLAEKTSPHELARSLADPTQTPDLGLRRMGRTAWKALPFMRPMVWHIIVILSLGFAMGVVVAFATTLGIDLFTNKVLVGGKIQPMQAFLLGLDSSYVVEPMDSGRAAAAEAADDASDVDPGLTDDQRRTVRTRMLVWFVAMGAFGLVLGTVLRYYGAWVWQNLSQYLRVTMIERLEHLSLRFHTDSRSGDALYRIIQDSAQIVNLLREAIINPITMVYTLVIALTYVTAFDALLLLGVALVAVPMLVLTILFTPRIRRRSVASRVAGSNLTSRLQETFAALKVVKASRAERLMLERFDKDSNRALDAALLLRFEMVVLSTLVMFFGGAAVIALEYAMAGWVIEARPTLLGAWAAAFLSFTLWNLGAFQAAGERLGASVGTGYGMVRVWCMIQDLFIGLERAFYFLDLEPEIVERASPAPYPRTVDSVTWLGVDFGYTPGQPVLNGVDLTAEAGKITAVVGATGSGKSTLMALLLRLYDPDRGAVLVNDVDLRDLRIDALRSNSAIALQKNVLFTGKVADNIGYATDASRVEIEEAARIACADEFIRELDSGFDTELGERGSKLSSGQRQRLTIARAVIRDTPILILDEPTASLDAETEHRVLANLGEWGADRIVLLITHRLSTIRGADRIAFLEDGRVAEVGSHDELMARRNGRYREFVQAETVGIAEASA